MKTYEHLPIRLPACNRLHLALRVYKAFSSQTCAKCGKSAAGFAHP